VAQRRNFAGDRLGRAVRGSVHLRCVAPKPVRIQVHPVLSGDTYTLIGSVLIVGTTGPARAIVSVALTNKGDPHARDLLGAPVLQGRRSFSARRRLVGRSVDPACQAVLALSGPNDGERRNALFRTFRHGTGTANVFRTENKILQSSLEFRH
jgi:hypothetical protein